jgi:serine/threonine protein kinase
MSRDLGLCPPADDLERLLAEQLSGPERETVESHVESCTTCQDRLERLSGEPARPVGNSALAAGPEPRAEFLRRLRETPPRADTSDLPASNHRHDLPSWFERGRIAQYEVLEKLGKGGMGTVYKARHVELGKVVALKVLPDDQMDEVRVGRFKNEVRAIGRLDHPHIVAAHDAGEVGGVHYLVMDFVDGEDFERVLQRHGQLSVADAYEAISQAADGLQHAFERGLVHRDIKPSNLMLTRAGRVQLLDLGLARSVVDRPADRLTADGMVLGTADYLAPEQWERSHAADIRADIYSLGCTLYHFLAGRPPFAGSRYASLIQKLRGHVDTPPPPIAGVRPEVPAAVVAVLDRMLAKAPGDRFASPAEVAAALRPFAAGADLGRLISASGTQTPYPSAADTGEAPDTLSEPRPDGHRTGPRGRRYARPLAVAGLCAALVVGALAFWPKRDRDTSPGPSPASIEGFRVKHYRGDPKKSLEFLGDLQTSPAAVQVKDSVVVAAELSTPAYYYLIAFSPAGTKEGTEQLCQPDDEAGEGARSAEPKKRTGVRYPREGGVFVVDAAELRVFVLGPATRPLPPYETWRNQARDIPWTGVTDGGNARWHSEGNEFTRLPRDRGDVVIGVPEPLRALRDWFKRRPEFDAVQILAFPVTDDRE